VHLLDWPKAGEVDEQIVTDMSRTRQIIEAGLGRRMVKSETEQQVKVRQPLSRLVYPGEPLPDALQTIVAEEVNVKQALNDVNAADVTVDKQLTPELKREGLMRELVRQVQTARKAAGLNIDDRIVLAIVSDDAEVLKTLEEHAEIIKSETLATSLNEAEANQYVIDLTVDGYAIAINLAKA
jgi:hypothetical protein